MMTREKQLDYEEKIRAAALSIATVEIEKLIRSELQFLSFQDWRVEFEQIIDFNRDLAEADLSVLPERFLEPFWNKTGRVVEIAGKILKYQYNENSPNERRELADKLVAAFNDQYDHVLSHLAFARTHAGSLRAEIAATQTAATDAKNAVQGAVDALKAADEEQKRVKRDGDKVLVALSKAAQNTAVSEEAKHFSTKADEFKRASRIWLVMALISGLMVLWVIGYVLDPDQAIPRLLSGESKSKPTAIAALKTERDAGQIAEHVLTRVALLTLFSTALWFCLKNYSSARHNYIVNDHRAVSLQTFQAFAAGTAPDVRAAILLQAASAAFTAQSSGYLKGEGGETPHGANFVDVVRSLADKG